MKTGVAHVVFVCGWLGTSITAAAQSAPPLSREQRNLLQTVVQAVDAAATQPETSDATLRRHVMRASDGSHYVAFSIEPPAAMPMPSGPVLLYVRLAPGPSSSTQGAGRSVVREWLAGGSVAPPPMLHGGIVIGEMPAMGAAAVMSRTPAVPGLIDLQLMELQRVRARERQEARDQQRRAELEGKAALSSDVMPFEDFAVASPAVTAKGARIIQRGLTAGPGDHSLYVAWADPAAASPGTTVRVVKKSLRLPPARANELTISSVILADSVRVRAAPYPPSEQGAHPYSLGLTEIAPAADSVFMADEKLAVAFQIISARPSDAGKPDLEIAFRVVRVAADEEEPIASITPQYYSAATLPADFDLRRGHPVLVAMTVPLETLNRGSYRLKILVSDRHAGTSTTADADFKVAGTAASLLKEAPPLAPVFRREAFIASDVLRNAVRSMRPAAPSPALGRAFDLAAAGRFVELVNEPVAAAEQGVRGALAGLTQLALGDALSVVQFQRAQLLGAPPGPVRVLTGAARAMQGRDLDAIAVWQEALVAGTPRALIAPFLLDAYLRLGDYQRAASFVAETTEAPAMAAWTRGVAATRIASGKQSDAIAMLDSHLAQHPDDADAEWLRLHALFSQFVGGDTANRARLAAHLRAYIDSKGTHAELAGEWLNAVAIDW